MPRGSPPWNELVRIWLRDSISNTSKHISEPVLFILGAYERAAVMKTSKLRHISSQQGFAFKRFSV